MFKLGFKGEGGPKCSYTWEARIWEDKRRALLTKAKIHKKQGGLLCILGYNRTRSWHAPGA